MIICQRYSGNILMEGNMEKVPISPGGMHLVPADHDAYNQLRVVLSADEVASIAEESEDFCSDLIEMILDVCHVPEHLRKDEYTLQDLHTTLTKTMRAIAKDGLDATAFG